MADSTMVVAIATSASGVLIAAGTTVATIISARRKAANDDVTSLTTRVTELQSTLRRLEVALNELYAYTIRLWRWAVLHEDLPEQFKDPPSRSFEDL